MTFANETHFADSRAAAMAGMALLRPYELHPHTAIYRFVDRRRCPTAPAAAHGAWWIEFEAFQQIKHFGIRHGYSLDYSARLHLAVLYEWSEITGVVRAVLKQPLRAWKGRGKQVTQGPPERRHPRDLPRMTPMQTVNEVYQLYIPGLAPGTAVSGESFATIEYAGA